MIKKECDERKIKEILMNEKTRKIKKEKDLSEDE